MQAAVAEVAERPTRGRRPPGARRLQILQTLATMLEDPKGERITTAALAKQIAVSEAALYRHFASKAQMFEGLIEFIETTIFGLINDIAAKENSGLAQAARTVTMLLDFAATNKGMTRVLTGEALVGEHARLQERINQLVDRIESSLRQSLRLAVTDGQLPADSDLGARAALIVAAVLGRWLRYSKSGFRKLPNEGLDAQLPLLLG
jgi:TetR/AcrR family transcriptional regulator